MMQYTTQEIKVYGIVQGVGFRPTVSRHAACCGIYGYVCNKGPYVQILAQGDEGAVSDFVAKIEKEPPDRAVILKIDAVPVESSVSYDSFEIVESEKETGEIFIPPDIAICEECKRELYDKTDRRYLHPFINCTCCGPRLTILDSLPYDRERTSMKSFEMCPSCRNEYYDPKSRRYDAQPVCCNECGPRVYLIGRPEHDQAAIRYARQVLHDGGIIAVKGIGGFHLCCDAKNASAVERLRRQKNRPAKPFAVMMRDIETVERECLLTKEQRDILCGHQKPILLLEKRKKSSLSRAIAPGNPKVGVMLPYAPIQLLLFDNQDEVNVSDTLVMTSGNTSGAPICREDADAQAELISLCDMVLSHDRDIRMRADDTVMDMFEGREYMIRRSRGYAPLPQFVQSNGEQHIQVIAMGGELKNSFCVGKGDLFYMSPYIGDMEDIRTVEAHRESAARFLDMLEVKPQAAVCDLHPKYNTTVLAEEYKIPIIRVQHHYAHIVSCMAENNYKDPVIGVSFDGTGYGTDHTIWGGELLLADTCSFKRAGHIASFIQIGGDLSAKEGWRIAVSMLYGLYKDETKTLEAVTALGLCTEADAKILIRMYDRKMNAVTSTSAGRLFDAVSAVLGICSHSTFEGEASTALQFAAEAYEKQVPRGERLRWTEDKAIPASAESSDDSGFALQTDRLFAWIVQMRQTGADASALAFAFHEALSEMIAEACVELRRQTKRNTVALSGGVFQNLLLLKLCRSQLQALDFEVLIHHLIPPNDGGLALGQAVVARNIIQNTK
ncbi:MAG: carbamoyltransferase HypF [Agathobacter sp.]|nr:carbamoyltransferase HypF [Agathobacter sp.]